MKIIGIKDDGYIIDVSKDEVANLMGLYGHYSNEFPRLKVGDDIDIKGLYTKYENGKYLRDDVNSLKSIIKHLEIATSDIEMITNLPKLEEMF